MLRVRLLFPAFLLAAIALAAGCGGGGATPFVHGASTPTPVPHVGATTVPVGASAQTVFIGDTSGNSASFTMPQALAGASANMTIAMSTSLPGGAPLPSGRRSTSRTTATAAPTKPNIVGANVTSIDYISVVMDGTFAISNSPTVTFSLGSLLAPSTQTYLLLWDPAISPGHQGWIVLLGPGIVGTPRSLVTFNGVPTGQTYAANTQYVYALVTTSSTVPTATPAPTPSAPAAPSFCSSYAVSSPKPGVTLNVTDSSNLPGSMLLVYVQQQVQSSPITYNTIAWMDQNGNFGNEPVALPAACFSTTLGSGVRNNPLVIPHHHAGRIYFVYYPKPAPSAAVPNPFASLAPHSTPNLGVGAFGGTWLYDKIEFNSDGGVVDTTQVDFLGLPIEMNVSGSASAAASPLPAALPSTCPSNSTPMTPFPIPEPTVGTIVGVSQCNFAAIFNTMAADTNYHSTVARLPLNGTGPVIDYRINSPGGSFSFNPFDWNLFADVSPRCPVLLPAPIAGGATGYLSCVLAYYQQHPTIFTAQPSLGGFGDGLNFCVTSDGSANFKITAIGTATSCSAVPMPLVTPHAMSGTPSQANPNPLVKNPFTMPIGLFTYAMPAPTPTPQPGSTASPENCTYAELFGAPWGNAQVDSPALAGSGGQLFATADAFTLWKAMIVELSYGTALQPGTHPIENTPPTLSQVFKDPLYNDYASAIHAHFDGGFAYAISYDDAFSWYSGYGYAGTTANTINVRINPIPTASPVTNPNPPASPNPAACNTVPTEVGSY